VSTDQRHTGSPESLWDQLRAEERADQLAQVVQDAVRDARLADVLSTPESQPEPERD
jgi:hypothetical protein